MPFRELKDINLRLKMSILGLKMLFYGPLGYTILRNKISIPFYGPCDVVILGGTAIILWIYGLISAGLKLSFCGPKDVSLQI